MKKLFLLILILSVFILLTGFYLQETQEIPKPPEAELPAWLAMVLGAIASMVSEFVQKQKSAWVSLAISIGLSVLAGFIGAIAENVPMSNVPVFIVQVFAYASATWAILFNMKKKIKK